MPTICTCSAPAGTIRVHDADCTLTRVATNPWVAGHLAAEREFGGSSAAVLSEYRDAPRPVDCTCGGFAHWKATIGAAKCPECGRLYDSQGDEY